MRMPHSGMATPLLISTRDGGQRPQRSSPGPREVVLIAVVLAAVVALVAWAVPRVWGKKAVAGALACKDLNQAEVAASLGVAVLPGQKDSDDSDPRPNDVCRFQVPSLNGSVQLYVKWDNASLKPVASFPAGVQRRPLTQPGFVGYSETAPGIQASSVLYEGHLFSIWLTSQPGLVRATATERLAESAAVHATHS
jgi:hypothetical protein